MKSINTKKWWCTSFCFFLYSFYLASPLFAAGYEKTVGWGARYAALGGAGAASVEGAESLFFNPAGLARGQKAELSLNISPYWSEYRAPIIQSFRTEESEQGIMPIGGVFGSLQLPHDLALGLGFFSAGGSQVKYNVLDFTVIDTDYNTLLAPMTSDFKIYEFTLGLSKIFGEKKEWSVGAAWRANMFRADFETVTLAPTALIDTRLTNLRDNTYGGFRLGAQYHQSEKKFGVGVMYRSAVSYKMTGTSAGNFESALGGSRFNLGGGGNVAAANTFPWQLNAGGFYHCTHVIFHGEYSFTQYSVDKVLEVTGDPLFAGATNVLSSLTQAWRDQHAFKIGAEIPWREHWTWRAGTALTTQVTGNGHARATTSTPANGYSTVVGAGFKRTRWGVDAAIDYSFAKNNSATTDGGVRGEFSSKALGLNLSGKLSY